MVKERILQEMPIGMSWSETEPLFKRRGFGQGRRFTCAGCQLRRIACRLGYRSHQKRARGRYHFGRFNPIMSHKGRARPVGIGARFKSPVCCAHHRIAPRLRARLYPFRAHILELFP